MDPERRDHFASLPILEARSQNGSHVISGYASVFWNPADPKTEFVSKNVHGEFRERIAPGAFDDVIHQRQDVVGLFNHDENLILGRTSAGTLELIQDNSGLRYRMHTPATSTAQEVAENVRVGNITGSSFAFTVGLDDQSVEHRDDGVFVRTVHRFDKIYDVGPVTYPAYSATTAERASHDLARLKDFFLAKLYRESAKNWLAQYGPPF